MSDQRLPITPPEGNPTTSTGRGRFRRPRFLAVAALLIGTGVIAGATDTPEVWAVPGVVLIAAMWIAGRPRRTLVRGALTAAIALSVVGAVLISPAVLFAWFAVGLVRIVRRRGIRGARRPLAIAAAVTALAVAAGQLGLPFGLAFVAIFPLVIIAHHRPGRQHGPRVTA
ncbi:MAG TPA: hypothetical protein VFR49_02170 [Solirubrobacteraceae bacterium]|nr:hypothetical protein [Solirubrobacteraceae bacterium]